MMALVAVLTGIIGRTFVSDQGVLNSNLFDNNLHFGEGLTFEVNYGRHLMGNGFARLTFEVPAVFVLGIWFLMQFLSGVGSIAQVEAGTGGVAFWAHVAGFAVGVLGGLLLRRPERQRVEYWHDR